MAKQEGIGRNRSECGELQRQLEFQSRQIHRISGVEKTPRRDRPTAHGERGVAREPRRISG